MSCGRIVEALTGREWDAATLDACQRRRASMFAQAGLSHGDIALLHYGNRGEFFVDLLAIWALGACAVPLDPRLTEPEIARLCEATRPRISIWDGQPPPDTASLLSSRAIRLFGLEEGFERKSHKLGEAAPAWRLDDPALILFTSGTTGEPKGVVHTHRSLHSQWQMLAQSLDLRTFDRTLCLLPTHFGHGLICNCLFPWLAGKDLVLLSPFESRVIPALGGIIDDCRITFMSSVPTIWRLALRLARPPSERTLQQVFCGSAPLSRQLWEQVRQWAGIDNVQNVYGITETASWLAQSRTQGGEFVDGLVGRSFGAAIRVMHSGSTEMPLADNPPCASEEEGFVWVRTPALMKGYYRRDDLTRAVVRQGWFSTGDIGVLDDTGRLHLRGRQREEINKGGTKIHPADVDAVVEGIAGVLDACSFAAPDPLYGETVGIAVVVEDDSAALRRQLLEAMRQRLAEHKRPSRLYLVPEIPRSARGKVNRAKVAEYCATLDPAAMDAAF